MGRRDARSHVPATVTASRYVWLIGSVLSVLSAGLGVALVPVPLTWILFGISVVQALLAVPAALLLTRRAGRARIVLMVLAAVSLGSLYQALKLQAWPSLVLNLALGATLAMLLSDDTKAFFGLPTRRPTA